MLREGMARQPWATSSIDHLCLAPQTLTASARQGYLLGFLFGMILLVGPRSFSFCLPMVHEEDGLVTERKGDDL